MGEDKDYKVIHEKIIPKKKRGRKYFGYLVLFLLAAMVFGVMERAAFHLSGYFFFPFAFEKKEHPNVELISHPEKEKKNDGKETPVIKKEEVQPTKTIVHKDIKVVEKKIDAGLPDFSTIMRAFGKVAEEENKSVVEVQSVIVGTDWFENPYETVTSTAGFVIAKQNDYAYILTRYSHIKKAENIKLAFSGGYLTDGVLKNYNSDLDLALLIANLKKMGEEEREGLQAVEVSNSEYINLGRPIMALGNPDGNMYSVLFGTVINTRGKEYRPDYEFDAFYADLRLAKDGVALIMDTEGRVLGIALGNKDEGSCKVLSIGRVVRLIENMINDEEIQYLGIVTKKFNGAEGKTGMTGGILIDGIVKDSPAEKAGFKKGDILYNFAGKKIESMNDFSEMLWNQKVGETVICKVYRVSRNIGSEVEIKAIIGDSRGVK